MKGVQGLLDVMSAEFVPAVFMSEFSYKDLIGGKSIVVVYDPYAAVKVGQYWIIKEHAYPGRETVGMASTGRECDVRVVEFTKGWVGVSSGYVVVRLEVMRQRVGENDAD